MSFLFGLLWFLGGALLSILSLIIIWQAEQKKWLSFFDLYKELPWYGLVGILTISFLSVFFWFTQPGLSALAIFLQTVISVVLLDTIISDIHFGKINLPILLVGSTAVLVGIGLSIVWLPSLLSALAAAFVAAVFFLWQYLLSRGQWVGSGDTWFGIFLGLLVGWPNVLIVAALGYGLAAITAFGLIIFFRKKNLQRLPLGAFLSISALLFFLFTLVPNL